jgi:hypothetical protein
VLQQSVVEYPMDKVCCYVCDDGAAMLCDSVPFLPSCYDMNCIYCGWSLDSSMGLKFTSLACFLYHWHSVWPCVSGSILT